MLHLNIPQETIEKATQLVDKYGFGKRRFANGNRTEQIVGITGELMIRELFGMEELEPDGFDGGYDLHFGNRLIDVKTMGRSVHPKEDFVNNLMAVQFKFRATHYIFCSLNKKTRVLTVCGWASKQDIQEKAEYFVEGFTRKRSDGTSFITKASLYEIKNSSLNRVFTPSDLIRDLVF